MALKLVEVISDTCVRCGGAAGPEVIPGDTVKLYLDQDANPDFPEWVEGTVISVAPQTEASTSPQEYTIQYEADDLDGSAALIRDCDVLSVICAGCCGIINDYLDLLAGVNLPEVQLYYDWVQDAGVWNLELVARAVSRQIAGNPGVPVTIDSYVFTDENAVVIPWADPDDLFVRFTTPADTGETDWPGMVYTVTVTDSEGLVGVASVYVPPRPRFRRETVTVVALDTSVVVALAAGEEIISVMQLSSADGFFLFALNADPAQIDISTAPPNDLDLSVLIHTP